VKALGFGAFWLAACFVGCTVVTDLDSFVGSPATDRRDQDGAPADAAEPPAKDDAAVVDSGDAGSPSDAQLVDAAETGPATEFAFVQYGTVDAPGTAVTTPIPVNATKAGSLLVVVVAEETNSTTVVSSIADNAPGGGSTYVSASQRSFNTGCSTSLEIWYATNARPGATSIAVTMGSSVKIEAWALEFSTSGQAVVLEAGKVLSSQPTGTIITAPTVTTAASKPLVISGAMTCGEVTGLRAPSTFQPLAILNGETVAYLLANQPGTYGAVWNSTSDMWNSSTVVFK
jgi:hypothetical protein